MYNGTHGECGMKTLPNTLNLAVCFLLNIKLGSTTEKVSCDLCRLMSGIVILQMLISMTGMM